MPFDGHANFAYGAVAVPPSPATSGTTIILGTGQGALFPTPPFNITIWPNLLAATASNSEIARCTGKTSDTLTIVRAQEGTSARVVVVTDQVAATVTAKALTDIESAIGSGGGGAVTTKRISALSFPGQKPFITILAADDSTVIVARAQTGVTPAGSNGLYYYDVDVTGGLTIFVAKWDQGNPVLYKKEYVVV